MRAVIALAVVALAHSAVAGSRFMGKRNSCTENPETGEHCCPDGNWTCFANQKCVPHSEGDGYVCEHNGQDPDLGQFGPKTRCSGAQLPCGEVKCFQPTLTSMCCPDGTVCINRSVCMPSKLYPGDFACCDPETDDCTGAPAPSSASSSASLAPMSSAKSSSEENVVSTTVSPVTSSTSPESTSTSTIELTSTIEVGCNSTASGHAKPTNLPIDWPTPANSCHGWTEHDFKVLNDAVVLLVDILGSKGYPREHHSCGCSGNGYEH